MAQSLGDLLEEYGNTIVERLKAKIVDKGLVASRVLLQSIDYKVKIFGKDYVMHIGWDSTAKDYALYADEGRKAGKAPPYPAILKWVRAKGLTFAKKNGGKWKNNAQMHGSLAYVIQQSIKKKGTIKRFGHKGSHFWDEVFTPELRKELKADIVKAVKRDVQIEFNELKKTVSSHGG